MLSRQLIKRRWARIKWKFWEDFVKAPPPVATVNINTIFIEKHKFKKGRRTTRPNRKVSFTGVNFTGIGSQSPEFLQLKFRKRRISVKRPRVRHVNFGMLFHIGGTLPGGGKSDWVGVKLQSFTRRGGY